MDEEVTKYTKASPTNLINTSVPSCVWTSTRTDYLLKVTFSEPPSRTMDVSRGFVSAILRPPLNE